MIDDIEDLGGHLAAGRRAAMSALLASLPIVEIGGPRPEVFNGTGDIILNGLKIGPAIDAAVMETVVRLHHPVARPWWKFWGHSR